MHTTNERRGRSVVDYRYITPCGERHFPILLAPWRMVIPFRHFDCQLQMNLPYHLRGAVPVPNSFVRGVVDVAHIQGITSMYLPTIW